MPGGDGGIARRENLQRGRRIPWDEPVQLRSLEGEEGNDEFRGIAEGSVEEPTQGGPDMPSQFLGRDTDVASEGVR
jgi:hypothetical protein